MISKVAVIGAGTMGAGIAEVAALSGFETVLFDVLPEGLAKGMDRIGKSWAKGVEKGKVSAEDVAKAKAFLRSETDLGKAVGTADLVIEAVPEKLDLKKSLYTQLKPLLKKEAILGTNTSSISITELAKASPNPARFLGLHFFNPPAILKLLEIVTHAGLDEAVLKACRAAADTLGRSSIIVKDSPGFATSRLAVAVAMEAIRMLEEGVASAADIDTAMEVGYRWPMGPLKLTDHIGLDVRLDITTYLHGALKSDVFKPPELMKKLVKEGKLGVKSGEGFYKHPKS
ncbi:MAG: 3-hydroxyacyl-CoA dehydrogenase family protein [Planctomycetota bacterium]